MDKKFIENKLKDLTKQYNININNLFSKKPSDLTILKLIVITFVLLLFFIKIDKKIFKSNQISAVETLKKSSFARGMFFDIGILSTIIGLWILWSEKGYWRIPFAIATFFVGSFAVLPFLCIKYLIKVFSNYNDNSRKTNNNLDKPYQTKNKIEIQVK